MWARSLGELSLERENVLHNLEEDDDDDDQLMNDPSQVVTHLIS